MFLVYQIFFVIGLWVRPTTVIFNNTFNTQISRIIFIQIGMWIYTQISLIIYFQTEIKMKTCGSSNKNLRIDIILFFSPGKFRCLPQSQYGGS